VEFLVVGLVTYGKKIASHWIKKLHGEAFGSPDVPAIKLSDNPSILESHK
jgi:hypothetical protein